MIINGKTVAKGCEDDEAMENGASLLGAELRELGLCNLEKRGLRGIS